MDYYVNGSRDCYRAALANLLLVLGDPVLAQHAYAAYPTHHLLNDDMSIHAICGMRIARDLTDKRLELRMRHNWGLSGENWEEKKKMVLREEQVANRVVFDGDPVCRNYPAIVLVFNNEAHHAVTAIAPDRFIDHGQEKHEENRIWRCVYDVAEFYPTNPSSHALNPR